MPEFCADCNHDRRDHFDDAGCAVSIQWGMEPHWWRRLKLHGWAPCPCNTYIGEEI